MKKIILLLCVLGLCSGCVFYPKGAPIAAKAAADEAARAAIRQGK